MMTSRSEYRLLLRQDNADMRLTEKGREIGLVKDDRWAKFTAKKAAIEEAMDMLRNTPVNPSKETQALLESLGTAPIRTGIHAYDLVKRNELSYAIVADAFGLKRYTPDVEEAVDISITYEGYIKKQMEQVDKVRKPEEKIPSKRMGLYTNQGHFPLKLNKSSTKFVLTPSAKQAVSLAYHLRTYLFC